MTSEEKRPLTEMEKELIQELDDFKKEKERVKKILGSLGGTKIARRDKMINMAFAVVVLGFFILELTTHFLPSFVSLEVGLLFLSIKIIWMMNSAHKVNHFQFWILNSIEYKVNQIDRKVINIEKRIHDLES
ncbi:hypothetical protein EXM22_00220 [Oceanispirochaeta crateris]|uniref:DUF4231 domain-containing protein n=1 Tax=Oceanispirochaeta crateris TaxID=2518645 RepID=A0A5C1QHM3_9SPIO|nr:hypothetical protein [Oceanispirochaeta crateris]QEN06490.1 hypothetical protein EXM22_00220 [Oceanispirochaeta crateris]